MPLRTVFANPVTNWFLLGLCDNGNSYITMMELIIMIITITIMYKVHLGSYGSELCNARISCHILSPLPFTVIPVLVRYITEYIYTSVLHLSQQFEVLTCLFA